MYNWTSKRGINITVSDEWYRECPICKTVKPVRDWGLRETAPGKIRDQPRCIKCRGKKDV